MQQERVDLQPAPKAAPAAGERVDPPRRDVDFAVRATAGIVVKNRDPRRKYVLVSGKEKISMYEERGYEAVLHTTDGAYLGSKRTGTPGTEIMHRDAMLMSIDRLRYEQIRLEGDPQLGDLGQRYYDPIEKRIVKGGGVDPMRGQHGPGKGMRVKIQDEYSED